ncbi:ankyrin repeat domain-containing protein 29 [Stylonychia lemnae]|uniref:Ankyrin repeat domain-containing protein 29 n=1 Tax=Stylonychia lemnae TaxID=5949 RepID=A0A078A784_STYLE|nr:ankyrin repeat domain-containing protein 29 [Stylonychia lemnae]|eukprot:CDW78109.1 ankyrin repeat domain-containing protein 29 [Stylonychia lemnae]
MDGNYLVAERLSAFLAEFQFDQEIPGIFIINLMEQQSPEEDLYLKYKKLIKYQKDLQYFKDQITQEDHSTLLNLEFSKQRTMDLTKVNVRIVHLAAKHNFIQLFHFLIREVKTPLSILDSINGAKRTPLMNACQKGHIELVKLLIEEGKCNSKFVSNSGSPLILAAESGNLELFKYLCSLKELTINDQDTVGLTPLYVACHTGNKSIVQYLLENQVNLNVKGPKNSNINHTLAERDFPEIVEMILAKDKTLILQPDDDGNTCMHTAILWSGMRLVQALFEAGGEELVRMKNNEGVDALEMAQEENQQEPYKYLCDKLGVKEQWTCNIF